MEDCALIILPFRIHRGISGQPKTNFSRGVDDGFGYHGGDIVWVWVFIIVNRPFGRNCLLFD